MPEPAKPQTPEAPVTKPAPVSIWDCMIINTVRTEATVLCPDAEHSFTIGLVDDGTSKKLAALLRQIEDLQERIQFRKNIMRPKIIEEAALADYQKRQAADEAEVERLDDEHTTLLYNQAVKKSVGFPTSEKDADFVEKVLREIPDKWLHRVYIATLALGNV